MDKTNYTTEEAIRERRKHLTFEDRVIIQTLFKKGYSQRRIAAELNCSPSTIHYEIKRGTRKKLAIKALHLNTQLGMLKSNMSKTGNPVDARIRC